MDYETEYVHQFIINHIDDTFNLKVIYGNLSFCMHFS